MRIYLIRTLRSHRAEPPQAIPPDADRTMRPGRHAAESAARVPPYEVFGVVIYSQRAAASAVSSGRGLNARAASGAALRTALMTFSNTGRAFGGSLRPAPITTQSL